MLHSSWCFQWLHFSDTSKCVSTRCKLTTSPYVCLFICIGLCRVNSQCCRQSNIAITIFTANGTETLAVEQQDGSYKLYGYKWFSSATDADMTFTLARVVNSAGQALDVRCFTYTYFKLWPLTHTGKGILFKRVFQRKYLSFRLMMSDWAFDLRFRLSAQAYHWFIFWLTHSYFLHPSRSFRQVIA